jgi:hypothetical protein
VAGVASGHRDCGTYRIGFFNEPGGRAFSRDFSTRHSSAGGEGIAGHRIFTFCTFVRVPFVFESAAVAVVNRVPVLFLQ